MERKKECKKFLSVRIGKEDYIKMKMKLIEEDKTLQQLIEQYVKKYIEKESKR